MGRKPNPYKNIEREFTLAGQTLPSDPLFKGIDTGENDLNPSVEVDVDLNPEITADNMRMLPDGSVTFDVDEEIGPEEVPFDGNLAEVLSDEELEDISTELISKIQEDDASREEWMRTYKEGLTLLGTAYEERSEPFRGATGVIHPLLNEAVSQFQAQAYKELLPPSGPVRTQVLGDTTPDLEKQATRVKDYMNYQIIHVMEEYDAEFDNMLYYLGLCGSAFKKVYIDPQIGRHVSRFVMAEHILVPFHTKDLMSAERITHIVHMSENEVRKMQINGMYRDIEVLPADNMIDSNELKEKKEELSGIEKSGPSEEVLLFECHCFLDLETFPDEDDTGEPTGIKLPYIVTMTEESNEILSIYRNWDEDDPFKKRRDFFVHYMFSPGLGFYGHGMIHLLSNLSRAATSNLRQLVDSGTLANLPSGFKARGLRLDEGEGPLNPGEWRNVDVVGEDLRNALMPLPYKEPSATLFSLLGFIVESAQKFVGTTDLGTGNIENSETPVGTTVALLERGSRIMSAVHKRLYNAMKNEFQLLSELIAVEENPTEYPYHVTGNEPGLKQADFDSRIDILPVANPNIFSMSQRVTLAQEQLKLAEARPDMHNLYEAYRRVYSALGIDNIEQILPPPTQPQPVSPVLENSSLASVMAGKTQLKAFPEQDHEAHIVAHVAYMKSPLSQANMAGLSLLQSHILEHISLWAINLVTEAQGGQAQGVQQGQIPQGAQIPQQGFDPQALQGAQGQGQNVDPNAVAQQEVQLQEAYLTDEAEILSSQQQDPLVGLKQQELQLRQQDQMEKQKQADEKLELDRQNAAQKAQLDAQRLGLEADKHQDTMRIAREKIASAEEIAEERNAIARQKNRNSGGQS